MSIVVKAASSLALLTCLAFPAHGADESLTPVIDMLEMLDAGTLDIQVIQDWHTVDGPVATRQKIINISVGHVWADQDYRIPVRMVVPLTGKATGFHLTGGHGLRDFQRDMRVNGVDRILLEGGVGLVHTMVQTLAQSDQKQLGKEMDDKFIETLNPRYSIQYWGWPATLMRSITAAYAETEHFAKGRIAMSGGSKNGATPSAVLIQDPRTTAVHASVSPIWDSPLRMCDEEAWAGLRAFNQRYVDGITKDTGKGGPERLLRHPFLGGTFGPIYNRRALAAGHSWEDLQKTAELVADHVFVTRNLKQLKTRNVDMFFHPGTHDFVCFDVAWGGRHHPKMPVYLECNAGHGQKPHPTAEKGQANKSAFLISHFFADAPDMPATPTISYQHTGDRITVTVSFPPDEPSESGRIWWIYNRGIDGSAAYLREHFPDEQWSDMQWDEARKVWTAEIELKKGVSHIDFFSNHRRTLTYKSAKYPTYVSSPYTRIQLTRS
ncbi:MAG: hypothetical protein GY758_12305 [Fuerstiella sp.]|nr:hypothetical protein [Fuerstiella sp.]